MENLAQAFLQFGTVLQWAGVALSPLLLLPLIALVLPRPLDPVTRHGAAIIDRISGAGLLLGMWCCVGLILVQIVIVMLRYVFGLSFAWLSEAVLYLFAAIFMIGAASALRDDAHVRVDILREKMSPRGRAIVDLAGCFLFAFPVMILILSAVRPSLARSWAQFEGSRETSGLPILFLFKTLVPVFALLLLLQALSQAMKAARVLRGLPVETKPETSGSTF